MMVWDSFLVKYYNFKVLGERGPAAEAEVQLATSRKEQERTFQDRNNIV